MKKLEVAVLAISLATVMNASADLLVNRGLPTANLNNVSGANRANVAWANGGYTPSSYVLEGDTFANTSLQAWDINTIRVWTVGTTTTTGLWGGVAGSSAISLVSSAGAISDATYADGSTYQGTGGSFIAMHEVDFAVNIVLAPGQTYDFFVDGTGGAATTPFVHASNAALSGSPQDGADNTMLNGTIVGGNFDQSSIATWTSLNNGWDKASDLNVQVLGSAVPEPTTFVAGALLLLPFGVGALRMLRKKQAA